MSKHDARKTILRIRELYQREELSKTSFKETNSYYENKKSSCLYSKHELSDVMKWLHAPAQKSVEKAKNTLTSAKEKEAFTWANAALYERWQDVDLDSNLLGSLDSSYQRSCVSSTMDLYPSSDMAKFVELVFCCPLFGSDCNGG